jgi:DNA-binding response OmpR family regulator
MARPPREPKILIVEDDYLIAALIERILISARYVVIGPIPRLFEALEEARQENFDAAILDINLNGERVYPVAEMLSKRNLPYLFITGYSDRDLPAEFSGRPRISKPFNSEELLGALSNLFRRPMARGDCGGDPRSTDQVPAAA